VDESFEFDFSLLKRTNYPVRQNRLYYLWQFFSCGDDGNDHIKMIMIACFAFMV
jgi:hypothetical protein